MGQQACVLPFRVPTYMLQTILVISELSATVSHALLLHIYFIFTVSRTDYFLLPHASSCNSLRDDAYSYREGRNCIIQTLLKSSHPDTESLQSSPSDRSSVYIQRKERLARGIFIPLEPREPHAWVLCTLARRQEA